MKDHAEVIALPPFIFLAGLLLGGVIDAVLPLPAVPTSILLAVLLAGLGTALMLWAGLTMTRAGTSFDPRQPSTAIVQHGPYAFSRNPIYLADVLLYLAVVAFSGWLAVLLLLPLVLWVLHWGVIVREERYLQNKFGSLYRDYQNKVRRWL